MQTFFSAMLELIRVRISVQIEFVEYKNIMSMESTFKDSEPVLMFL